MDLKTGKTRKIQAYQIDDSILIVWSQVSNCDEYDLEVDGEIITCKDIDSYHHYNLVAGTNHSYRVRAKNSYGVGEWSDIVYKTYELEQLSIPEDVKSISKSNEIDISWKEVFNAKEYQLEINGEIKNIGNNTNYTIDNLKENTRYTLRVRALAGNIIGKWSELIIIDTLESEDNESNTSNYKKEDTYDELIDEDPRGTTNRKGKLK